jgi:hypothetical protein
MTALVLSPAELHGFCQLIIQRGLGHYCLREPSHLRGCLTRKMGLNEACIQKANRIKIILVIFRSDYHFIISL